MTTSNQSISIIVPVYCGANYLERLCNAIQEFMDELKKTEMPLQVIETLFVLDEPVDNSSEIIEGLKSKYSWITKLELSTNFGQHAATIAGILYSSCDWIVTLDEDLQHDPAEIPVLFKSLLMQDADIAYAKPQENVHAGLFRDLTSRTYKKIISSLTGINNIKHFNSFRLIRGEIARAAAACAAHDIFFDIALTWYSSRATYTEIEMSDERHINTNKSGYSISKLFSHAKRMVVTSHMRILNRAAFFGVLSLILSMFYLIYILAHNLLIGGVDPIARGWPSLMVVNLFFGGTLLLFMSIIFEYTSFLVAKANGRPKFFVIDRSSDKLLKHFFLER